MRSGAWFVGGFLTAVVIATVLSVVVLNMATHGFSANAQPTALEAWAARKARDLALPNAEKQKTNPVPNTPEVLSEARAHWADHCATCHANNGSGQTQMGELSSAIMSSRSSGRLCPSILVMQAAEDWFGGHTRKCGKSGRLF